MAALFDELLLNPNLIRRRAEEEAPLSAKLEFGNSQPRNAQTAVRKTNVGRQDPVEVITLDLGLLDDDDRRYLINVVRGGKGSAVGLRVYLPHDHTMEGEVIGIGDGVQTAFPLVLTYSRPGPASHMALGAAHPDVRRIFKPVAAAAVETNGFELLEPNGSDTRVITNPFTVFLDGDVAASGWQVNVRNGVLTFSDPVPDDVVIAVTCDFDVPMAFDGNAFTQLYRVPSGAQFVLREMLGAELGIM